MLSLWYVPVCECVCACVYGAYVEVGRLVRFSLLHHVGCSDQSYLTRLCGGIQRDNFQYMTPTIPYQAKNSWQMWNCV